jgi:hypothetical protein
MVEGALIIAYLEHMKLVEKLVSTVAKISKSKLAPSLIVYLDRGKLLSIYHISGEYGKKTGP